MKKRTESQPALESKRLPSLTTRSTSQPPDASLRKAARGDEVFSIMVMRQLQLRKDLEGQAKQLAASLPRLNSKTADSTSQQEQAAAMIASMADAMMKRGHARQTNQREERRGDGEHWPSLVQQAALAASYAAQAEAGGSSPLDRRGLSKSSLGPTEEHLSPFETLVVERRRARAVKEAAEARRRLPDQEVQATKHEEMRPETPSYPSPFKEQPPPPPMPPDWSEWAWEKKKTELAAERLRRQCQEEEERAAPSPPPCAAPPGRGVPSPSEDLPNNWRPWRCPIFPWQKAEERRPSKPSRRSPGSGPSSSSEAKEDPGPNDPGAGFGRAWNWGAGIFSGHSKVGAFNSTELARQEVDQVTERTNELIAMLDAEMSSTKDRPLEARRRVFKDLQRRFHPDKNPAEEHAATLAFQHLMASRQGYLRA